MLHNISKLHPTVPLYLSDFLSFEKSLSGIEPSSIFYKRRRKWKDKIFISRDSTIYPENQRRSQKVLGVIDDQFIMWFTHFDGQNY